MRKNRDFKKITRILNKVKQHTEDTKRLSDEALAGKTIEFKKRLANGETLDDLLPEAFAVICEADKRILGTYPYDVQILGGIAMHLGYLAEMNTGEGKTLTATLPLYLNALDGKGAILVTANEYLAQRDAMEMGPVYEFMGLSIATGVRTGEEEGFTNDEKKEIYASDIVYTTHGVLGFDYLFNNLVKSAEERFMRDLHYVIIDEADSVLLDGAQTPLVISGSPRVQSNLYELADFFVTTLEEGRDYETEERKVWLTKKGVDYAERFFRIDNFYGEEFFEINRHVTLALRAHILFEKTKDYMISKDNELVLLDSGSGRMMAGVKLRGGQHQALEVKEKLKVSQENRSVASVTFQNLFLLFDKMAGMSGTMDDAKDELLDVYGKKVVVIPPNRPMQRKDLPDLYFKDAKSQVESAMKAVLDIHAKEQPVLIVVSTIRQTEMISDILLEHSIAHNVLNANNAFWEADIIKEAGRRNAVTVSTSMAGRGTDIKLGEGVYDLGGLAVIGVGRMGNVRQERQARGRAGRQGDPGFSRFYVSLQDEVVKNSGYPQLDQYIEGKRFITKRKTKKLIHTAQALDEEYAVVARKQSVGYDQVLKRQRNLIYDMRNALLDGEEINKSKVLDIAEKNIKLFLKAHPKPDIKDVNRYILDHISYRLDGTADRIDLTNRFEIEEYLMKLVSRGIEMQCRQLRGTEMLSEFIKIAILNAIDETWIEQVDYLQQLQSAVAGRSTAQRNSLFEYREEGLESFRKMQETVWDRIMKNVLLGSFFYDKKKQMQILAP